uniref:O-acetyl-ADP-ribose deacetylase n=1 Tax=Roseihalotalea indica TaxID=2867963 RepID=A0AA49JET7_9BACT|nr:O-acetyl-ADP-ribose deacetylase [Tunicatimonas sp. TK19036]
MKISLQRGDITEIQVDAVVNAANSSLMGGGGVDGAIHRKGGPAILEECRKIRDKQGKCPTGEAVITTAGNLPATYVIHTVGPVWNGGHKDEADKLSNCYRNSLKLAEEHNVKRIAFPNISTGIYGYPKDKAAEIAVNEVQHYQSDTLEEVVFVCFDEENYRLYEQQLE